MEVRTRFAPSPTGYLHIGSLRTALYCYLWAKNQNGSYIVRIEDTDQKRYVEGSVENLIMSLEICHIIHDEGPIIEDGIIKEVGDYGPYFQSDRLDIYNKYIEILLEKGLAYYCFCTKERLDELREEQKEQGLTPKYDSKCANLSQEEVQKRLNDHVPYVIRMKLPNSTEVEFDDLVYGHISINTNDIDEQVLIKADGFPTYHFAVVVDDHEMNISHVIRGEEWLVSTPKHLLLYQAFGWEPPKYAHLPTVLNQDKKKLSKRDGSAAVEDFLKLGYLPEALINYITLLGWSDPENRDIFALNEIIPQFSLDRINKSGAVFDIDKLNWVNSQYIKDLDDLELAYAIKPYLVETDILTDADNQKILYIAECVKDRISYLQQVVDESLMILADYELIDSEDVKQALAFDTNQELYEHLIEQISTLEDLTPDDLTSIFKSLQKEKGIKGKKLYMGIRIAVTGDVHGPDIKLVMCILGKDIVLDRLQNALKRYK